MAGLILVLNAGSSTLKAALVEHGADPPSVSITEPWDEDRSRTVERVLADLVGDRSISAVGHRVVHGGASFTEPVLVDDSVLAKLDGLGEIAPLHNAVAVEVIRAARRLLGDKQHVCCFDTAFHGSLPEVAWRYPVPWEWESKWGIRRFGFHGLSVEWSVRRASELLGRSPAELSLVVAHLGSGSSVTAVDRGRSAWTSMGLTPLEGLMMGTRSGSIDPGILMHLLRSGRIGVEELDEALETRSGLLGVSGSGSDMRELRAAAGAGDQRALLAIEMFVARAAEGVAAAMTWTRPNALVFTGGIGENDAATRDEICARLAPLPALPPVLVVEAHEEIVIADAVMRLTR